MKKMFNIFKKPEDKKQQSYLIIIQKPGKPNIYDLRQEDSNILKTYLELKKQGDETISIKELPAFGKLEIKVIKENGN